MAKLRPVDIRVIAYQESLRVWIAVHWRALHRCRRAAKRAARRGAYPDAQFYQARAEAHRLTLETLRHIRRENKGVCK